MTLADCDKLYRKGFYVTIKNHANIMYVILGKECSKNGS